MKNLLFISVLIGFGLFLIGCSSPVATGLNDELATTVDVTGVILTESTLTVGTTRSMSIFRMLTPSFSQY